MYNNILRIGFSRLTKNDVKTLAGRVMTIVEGYDPETCKIKEIYDLLVELQPQIESLRMRDLAHPISKELGALRRQRIAFAQGIIDKMKTIEYGKMTGKMESLTLAKPLVLQHLQGLSSMSEDDIYQNIIGFFRHSSNNQELATALDDLELTSYLDSLKSVNSTIERKFIVRGKSVSERPKNPTPGIVAKVKIAIEDLFKQIEIAQLKNQALDYKPLVDELNNAIAHLQAKLKARASYNKKKAEEKLDNTEVVEKQDEVVIETSSEEPSQSTESTERMYPMNVEVENEDNLEQLDIKKTVAVSDKQLRLPIVSTEA